MIKSESNKDNSSNDYSLNDVFNDSYNSTAGIFTVPPGGEGFYYFSTSLVVREAENGYFHMQINGDTMCTAFTNQEETPSSAGPATCSAAAYATPGTWTFH